MHEIERRTGPQKNAIEYRDDGKTPVITGYAAVFESESRNLGGFIETIHRRAFDRVLASKPDVVGVYNHDKNFLLGRTGNGTMSLSIDEYGLRYAIHPPATRADVVEAVQRGDVVGSSFAFAISDGGDVWSRGSDGVRRREIREIGLLDDVGPVVRPAYDSSSVVVSRRALEMALGETHRPNQTMANAAKRGLKLAARHEGVDEGVVMVAERVAGREILAVEEISVLEGVFQRCLAAKSAGAWAGTPAWIEWQLAGGDSGLKWVQRRSQSVAVPAADVSSTAHRSEPRAEVSLVPSAAMAAAARKGLKLHEAGRSGDGLKPETVARAKRIAAREQLTPEHVREMRAWFRRHKVDKRAGWDKPGDESAGYTAWQLWGGNPGWRWAETKVSQMGEARDLPEDSGEMEESLPGSLTPANEALYEAYELIVEEHGKWPQSLPAGAHYMEESPFAERGLVCSNCLFFEGGGACEIVQGDIAADGICKLNVIPEEKMSNERSEPAVAEVTEEKVEVQEPQPDYEAQVAALRLAALQIHLHGNEAAS
jgi:HK97 family phage prohead protease